MTRHIAIIGYAESCWPPEEVWADPLIEKWVLNHGHNIDPRWSRLFEFHSREVIQEESRLHFRGVDQWEALRSEKTRPIYMKDVHPEIARSEKFPLREFIQFFGARCEKLLQRPYAEMAAAYMLGYAIMVLQHVPPSHRKISVYGFELFDGDEYAHQRACFEFYSGYALGSNITLSVPETSGIFSNRGLYEYDNGETNRLLNQADLFLRQRFDEVKRKFNTVHAKQEELVAEMQTLSGIMQEVEQQQKFVKHLLHGGNYK